MVVGTASSIALCLALEADKDSGATIMCSSFSLAQFVAARVITGFGNGLNTSTVPTWQSECSKSHRRGMLVMIEGVSRST